MTWTVERLTLDSPLTFQEQIGDPVSDFGGTAVPAPRQALRHSVSLLTVNAVTATDTVAARLTLRRQLRSLMNNSPYKIGGFYVVYSDDAENSGWYVPDMGQMVDLDGSSGLATGMWKLENVVWRKVGTRRTHRRAVLTYTKDLRTGLYPRDYYRQKYSTDWSALTAAPYIYLPPASTDPLVNDSGLPAVATAMPAGWDGSANALITSPGTVLDQTTFSFEEPEASQNLGGVIAYDRQGFVGPFGSGVYDTPAGLINPQTAYGWDEVYGSDFPFTAADVPVIQNALCRCRYETLTARPGFKVDVWTGTTWAEQGKMVLQHHNVSAGLSGFLDTLQSATVLEYTQHRAVIGAIFTSSSDTTVRDRVVITLERGWTGPRFEVYPSPQTSGSVAGSKAWWQLPSNPTNSTLYTPGTVVEATAGEGITAFAGSSHTIGTENWCSLLLQGNAYNPSFAIVQAGLTATSASNGGIGYAGGNNTAIIDDASGNLGYLSVQLGFSLCVSSQTIEAESIKSTSATATIISDAAASGGQAVKDTQTTGVANTLLSGATNLRAGAYRAVVRIKITTPASGFASASLNSGANLVTTGGFANTAYVWLDMGLATSGAASPVNLLATTTNSSDPVVVDRLEFIKAQDRGVAGTETFDGTQDLAQSVLYDSRILSTIVARS